MARARPDLCGHWQSAGYWELGSVRLFTFTKLSGSNSVVESQLPKLLAGGSIPLSRSIFVVSCGQNHTGLRSHCTPLTPSTRIGLT